MQLFQLCSLVPEVLVHALPSAALFSSPTVDLAWPCEALSDFNQPSLDSLLRSYMSIWQALPGPEAPETAQIPGPEKWSTTFCVSLAPAFLSAPPGCGTVNTTTTEATNHPYTAPPVSHPNTVFTNETTAGWQLKPWPNTGIVNMSEPPIYKLDFYSFPPPQQHNTKEDLLCVNWTLSIIIILVVKEILQMIAYS